jgi:hypothetical protein
MDKCMQKASFTCSSEEYLQSIFRQCRQAIKDHGFIKIELNAGSNRSLSQNALYWMWMGEMATHFASRGAEIDKDKAHDLMRHQHLGYEDIVINNTVINSQLKSTTKLTKGEMHDYMEKVDAWAADHGVLLPHPEDSEYMKCIERGFV